MKIAFIGGGHMAHALIAGLYKTTTILVAERNAEKRQQLEQEFGIETTAALPAQTAVDAIVLAVRPPQALAVCATLPPAGVLLSVVAGLRCNDIMQASGRSAAQVIRIMPNTPSQVGLGMTFGYADSSVCTADKQLAADIFSAVGQFAWVENEPLLDAVTAVSGSAPAYIYYIIESMQEAAQQLGLDGDVARAAILQTIRGACAMVEASTQTPAQLAAAVAVPGGTTARALAVMQQAQMKQTIIQAMHACTARASEMGDELKTK